MTEMIKALFHKWYPLAKTTTSFAGKTIIITGANSGIGFEAASRFVDLQASKVILAVRSIQKGEEAKSIIEQRTGRKDAVEVWQLDMSSYDSIGAFAQRASGLSRVDVAILNAGVYHAEFQSSQYGWEDDFQTNVLSTAYLGLLLMPVLKASQEGDATPVLEIVGSGTHTRVTLEPSERQAENLLQVFNDQSQTFNARRQYSISKLFVMYVMQSLAKIGEDTAGEPQVIVNAVCPGATKSNLARDYSSLGARIGKFLLFTLFFRSTEVGSRTLVSGVTLGKKSHTSFWQHDTLQPPVPLVSGEEGEKLRQKVWHEVIDALRKDAPDALQLGKL